MLLFSSSPLTSRCFDAHARDPETGACVVFEGRVRGQSHGHAVAHLEYEAAEEQAVREFEAIAAEARAKFDVLAVRCAHRLGRIAAGDVAVIVVVHARHRAPAFQACQYAMDQLKHRLPVWKKEVYADGTASWINADPHAPRS